MYLVYLWVRTDQSDAYVVFEVVSHKEGGLCVLPCVAASIDEGMPVGPAVIGIKDCRCEIARN